MLTYRPADTPGAMPCVAFAIGRAVGPAVVRNRVRRRAREAFRHVAEAEPDLVEPGHYLVAVRDPDATVDELVSWLTTALGKLRT